ncbi:MAG: Rpn family recombination-promoting nuclease/putative transposase [Marinifilaceae bacterium]|jgi:predicted transposase/invertase (TIGR01784 family)|nr:Rpn family recombination-promoting nuclease/putative transposase [Marinifilaceae bacterium]
MDEEKEEFVNPFTDFGFKRLFGEEPNKDLLLDFLNSVLVNYTGQLKNLSYKSTEKLGFTRSDRKAIFDIYCENEKGEKFIIEMQKAKQDYFKERSIYYSSFPIQEQAEKGEWDFDLKAVFTLGILDFEFNDNEKDSKCRTDAQLHDVVTKEVFYDKLTFIYFEMPKFKKTIDELETRFDKWMYILKNLHILDRMPMKLKEKIFNKVFDVARVANFTKDEHKAYQQSLKVYRDLYNTYNTAVREGHQAGHKLGFAEGKAEGKAEGILESRFIVARKMIAEDIDIELVSKITGIEIEDLKNM